MRKGDWGRGQYTEESPFASDVCAEIKQYSVSLGKEGTKRVHRADGTACAKPRDKRGLVSLEELQLKSLTPFQGQW